MRRVLVALSAVLLLTGAANAADEQLKSPALAHELGALLKQHGLDAYAMPDPSAPDRFIAVLFFQGEQLLLVAGRHPQPSLIQQRLQYKQYGDVYQDLTVGCVPEGKLFIHDLSADGLRLGSGGTVDIMYEQVAN